MRNNIITAIAVLALAGCEYSAPLAPQPEIPIDRAIIGLWQRPRDGEKTESLLILPLSDREYLVSFPVGAPDAMFAKACLWRGAGLTLAQLDWFGTARGAVPREKRTYQFAAYALEGENLKIRMLNSEVVPAEAATSEALAEAVRRSKEDPELLREEMIFTKVKADQ